DPREYRRARLDRYAHDRESAARRGLHAEGPAPRAPAPLGRGRRLRRHRRLPGQRRQPLPYRRRLHHRRWVLDFLGNCTPPHPSPLPLRGRGDWIARTRWLRQDDRPKEQTMTTRRIVTLSLVILA